MSKIAREISKKVSAAALATTLLVQVVPSVSVSAAETGTLEETTVIESNTYDKELVPELTNVVKDETIAEEAPSIPQKEEALEKNVAATGIEEKLNTNADDENVVNISDKNLEKIIRRNRALKDDEKITKDVLAELQSITIEAKDNVKNLKGLEYCSGLEYIELEYKSDMDISAIRNLSSVKGVSVKGDAIDLNEFSKFVNLEVLQVEKVKNTNLNALKNCTNLSILKITSRDITDISAVSNMKKLEVLWIDAVSYSESVSGDVVRGKLEDISPIVDLPNLHTAVFSYQGIKNIDILAKAKFTSIDLEGCNISDISGLISQIPEERLALIWLHNNNIADPTPLFQKKYKFVIASGQKVTLPEIVTEGGNVVYKIPYGDYVTDVQIDEKDGKYNPETKEITFYNVTSDKKVTYTIRTQNNLDSSDMYNNLPKDTDEAGYDYIATVTQSFKIGTPKTEVVEDTNNSGQVSSENKVVVSSNNDTSFSEKSPKTGDAGMLGALSLAAISIVGAVKSRKRK